MRRVYRNYAILDETLFLKVLDTLKQKFSVVCGLEKIIPDVIRTECLDRAKEYWGGLWGLLA